MKNIIKNLIATFTIIGCFAFVNVLLNMDIGYLYFASLGVFAGQYYSKMFIHILNGKSFIFKN
jgi:hypothetical protein